MLKRFAVIGKPIEHSLSPLIHQHFAKQTHLQLLYEKILGDDLFTRQVLDFFNAKGCGLNITLPFKQKAFALATHKTKRCIAAGAANTLWMEHNQLHADNTDGVGLIRDLSRFMVLREKKILILGAGGAARGVIPPLLETTTNQITIANRSIEKAISLRLAFPDIQIISLANLTGTFDVIINATSASLDEQSIILPRELWASQPFCYDLAYLQKGPTSFVAEAKEKGCQAYDGLGMLIEQAAESFFIWHGIRPDTDSLVTLLCNLR
jgi:shikimate dehydrogenase